MSNTEPNLVGVEVTAGDPVNVIRRMEAMRLNTSERVMLDPETELVVTRVYSNSILVRTVNPIRISHHWGGAEDARASFSIDRMYLTITDPSRRPRRIGEKPEDTDDMTYVSIDDPGIQWIWEDLGRYATEQNYCNQYDALCARIGIPGRPRDFNVTLELGGVRFAATVQARSQREANERARAAAGLVDKAGVEVISEPE